MSKKYSIITSIIPARLIYQKKMYAIKTIDVDYIINKYTIYLDKKNNIQNIYLDANHPNVDPMNDIFCLPEEIKNKQLSKSLINNIEILIESYNLDSCYFMPWDFITYMKYNHKEYIYNKEKRKSSMIMKSYKFINKIRNFGLKID